MKTKAFDIRNIQNHKIESEFELDSIFLLHHGILVNDDSYNTELSKKMRCDLVYKKHLDILYSEFLDYCTLRDNDWFRIYNDIYIVGDAVNKYINSCVDFGEFLRKCPQAISKQPEPIDGHRYLVIDMCEATVQTLNYYGFDIGGKTWDEIISKFTNEPYLKHQKNLRNYAFIDLLLCDNNRIAKAYIENMVSRILGLKTNKPLYDLLNDKSFDKIIVLDSLSIDITNNCNICLCETTFDEFEKSIYEKLGMRVRLKIITYQHHQQVLDHIYQDNCL